MSSVYSIFVGSQWCGIFLKSQLYQSGNGYSIYYTPKSLHTEEYVRTHARNMRSEDTAPTLNVCAPHLIIVTMYQILSLCQILRL